MTFSGTNEDGNTNTSVEIYTIGSGWSQQYQAGWTPPLYPRMHLLPDGNVFYSGPGTSSALFNPSNTSWTLNVAHTNYGGTRTYGTSVLLPLTPANNYDPIVTIMGGNSPATNTTELIDMGAESPKWVYGLDMSEARIEMNAVILADGRILAVGGSVNDEDTDSLSLKADLFDLRKVNLNTNPPNLGTVSSALSNATERLYHSVALLLPDATVWLAGGNPERGTYNNTIEIYQPPYLFNSNGGLAARPTITSAPSSITYGDAFTVQTPNASSISSVSLVRNGTVTHAFGMDQRLVGLAFTAGSGSLTITAPPSGDIAPPGYYMLFILNSSGVPSLAQMVQLLPAGGISFIQVASATPQAKTATVNVTYPASQTAGDLNIVVVGWNDTTSTVQSVKDSAGNAYNLAIGPTKGTGLQESIYYAANIAGGSNTVTVAFNQAAAAPDIRILEYRGVTTLDAKAGASGTGGAANSGSATTTSANELIFGAQHCGHGDRGGRQRIHVEDRHAGRGHCRRQGRDGNRQLQRHGHPGRLWIMGHADGDVRDGFCSNANGDRCFTEQWTNGGRDARDDHWNELCIGGDGDFRRDSSDGCGRGEQHDDHGHDPGPCGGGGNRHSDGERPER